MKNKILPIITVIVIIIAVYVVAFVPKNNEENNKMDENNTSNQLSQEENEEATFNNNEDIEIRNEESDAENPTLSNNITEENEKIVENNTSNQGENEKEAEQTSNKEDVKIKPNESNVTVNNNENTEIRPNESNTTVNNKNVEIKTDESNATVNNVTNEKSNEENEKTAQSNTSSNISQAKIMKATLTDNGDVEIKLDDLDTANATFINYMSNGTNIELVAIKDEQNNIDVAFNTCKVCNGSPKAYFIQSNDKLVCKNCGNKFSMESIGASARGCNPITIADTNVTKTDTGIIISKEFLSQNEELFVNVVKH